MATTILSNKRSLLALAACAAVAFSILAFGGGHAARAASVFDITFPIPELGGCADRTACKAYCDDPANHDACLAFAQDHGLAVAPQTSAEDASSSSAQSGDSGDRLKAIEKDGGPGNCAAGAADPEGACRAYCNYTSHIAACVAYGKSHGLLSGDDLSKAEKVAQALASGVPPPKGCTDQASCKTTCENPQSLDQAKSCFAFAKAAGLLPPGFDETKAESVFTAIGNGTAPFKTAKDFQQCDHPSSADILKKCADFAVQNGFMTEQEAKTVIATGGKGPGDCQGKDQCDAYCKAHAEECYQFAKDHGLVNPGQEQQRQQGIDQFRANLSRASDAVKQCIVSAIGQDALDGILSGSSTPDQSIGEQIRPCFESLAGPQGENNGQSGNMDSGQGMDNGGFGPRNDGPHTGPAGSSTGPMQHGVQGFQNMPPEVAACVSEKYGGSAAQELKQGPAQGALAQAVRDCFSQIKGPNGIRPPEADRQPPPGYNGQGGPDGTTSAAMMMRKGGDGERTQPNDMPPQNVRPDQSGEPQPRQGDVPPGTLGVPPPPSDSFPPPPPPSGASATTSFLPSLTSLVASVFGAFLRH